MAILDNNYGNQDLLFASDLQELLSNYVSRGEKDGKPFPRQVDAWWLAIGIGVSIGTRSNLPQDTHKFNDGGVLNTDPWRVTHLEALALAEEGDEVLESPRDVIRIANEYAHTGLRWLLDQLIGQAEPTLALMVSIDDHLGGDAAP